MGFIYNIVFVTSAAGYIVSTAIVCFELEYFIYLFQWSLLCIWHHSVDVYRVGYGDGCDPRDQELLLSKHDLSSSGLLAMYITATVSWIFDNDRSHDIF
jgi:hypothetical protein